MPVEDRSSTLHSLVAKTEGLHARERSHHHHAWCTVRATQAWPALSSQRRLKPVGLSRPARRRRRRGRVLGRRHTPRRARDAPQDARGREGQRLRAAGATYLRDNRTGSQENEDGGESLEAAVGRTVCIMNVYGCRLLCASGATASGLSAPDDGAAPAPR